MEGNGHEAEDMQFFRSLLPHMHNIKEQERIQLRQECMALVAKYAYKKDFKKERISKDDSNLMFFLLIFSILGSIGLSFLYFY